MKKAASLALVGFLIILSIVPCMAEGNGLITDHPKKSKQAANTVATIVVSGTSATVRGSFSGNGITKGTVKLELQKKSGSSYQTVKTWSKTVTGSSGAYSEKKVINPSATYRLKATFKLYFGNRSQTYVKYAS